MLLSLNGEKRNEKKKKQEGELQYNNKRKKPKNGRKQYKIYNGYKRKYIYTIIFRLSQENERKHTYTQTLNSQKMDKTKNRQTDRQTDRHNVTRL